MTGCGSRIVTQYETQVIAPNDNLLQIIEVIPPPDRQRFIEADPDERLLMLMQAYNRQTTQLGICNAQTERLIEWKQRVIDVYRNQENTNIITDR